MTSQSTNRSYKNNKQDTLLFVHGAWHGKWCWEEHFRAYFEAAGYHVVTFDLPKHEQAGKVKGINTLTIGNYVKALAKQAKQIKTDTGAEPIIVGHSLGGFVVQHYLRKHTAKKAILLAPSPYYGVTLTTLRLAQKPYFYPALLGFNLYHLVNSPKKARFAFFSDALSDAKVNQYTNQLCSESYAAFLGMLKPVPLALGKSKHKQTPMLVVAAELDTIFSIGDMQRTVAHYGADYALITDSGHDLMLDVKWQETANTMREWLSRA